MKSKKENRLLNLAGKLAKAEAARAKSAGRRHVQEFCISRNVRRRSNATWEVTKLKFAH